MEAKIQKLQRISQKQHEVIEEIADAYRPNGGVLLFLLNLIFLPIRLRLAVNSINNYFSTLKFQDMKFNKQTIVDSFKLINLYENKEIAPKAYADTIVKLLKLPHVCDTCGDVMARLHSDFQTRVLSEAAAAFPSMIRKVKFKSGKYSNGGHHENRIPKLSYANMRKILQQMENDVKLFKRIPSQIPLLKQDIETLKLYIALRLKNFAAEEGEEAVCFEQIEESEKSAEAEKGAPIVTTETTEEVIEEKEVIAEEVTEETIEETTTEEAEEIIEEAIEEAAAETEATIEENGTNSVEWNVEAAAKMRESEMTFAEIGEYFGLSASTVRGRIKKYNDANNA